MPCVITETMNEPTCVTPPHLAPPVSQSPVVPHLATIHHAIAGGLPFTGADVLQLGMIGVGVIILGALLRVVKS